MARNFLIMPSNHTKIQLKLFQKEQLKKQQNQQVFWFVIKLPLKLQKLQKYYHKTFQRHLKMKQIRKKRDMSSEERQQIIDKSGLI